MKSVLGGWIKCECEGVIIAIYNQLFYSNNLQY